ncbi:ADP-ribosylation factor 1 [Dendrobium catenatum]|uniref:ADP-ribosylation factor 1 n=1 Tax=Dendrobium catenatum TaxID=906689 RepID=A0A2I0VJ24_9ASPA|nr:ADP-ribosylation factor 1 [Dendrobium catenatum]
MGLLFTRMLYSIFGSREAQILVLVLDKAGKTMIIYKPSFLFLSVSLLLGYQWQVIRGNDDNQG